MAGAKHVAGAWRTLGQRVRTAFAVLTAVLVLAYLATAIAQTRPRPAPERVASRNVGRAGDPRAGGGAEPGARLPRDAAGQGEPSQAQVATWEGLPPLTKAQAMRLLSLTAQSPGLDEHSFAKVGDSMTVSRSYLRCFARSGVNWGAFPDLRATATHFREGHRRGRNPFLRDSEAARVGWSVRSAIRGTPSPLHRELRFMRPRFATVMFGTNDIESRAPRRFGRRMWRLLEELEGRGVVPVVSTVLPQRRSAEVNRWVARYNLVLRALTEGRDLPILDLYSDYRALPRLGLAGDGIHGNVYQDRGRAAPCDLTPAGLRFGHNVRNLRTLQQLDRFLAVLRGRPVPLVQSPPQREEQTPLSLPHASIEHFGTEGSRARAFPLQLRARRRLNVLAIAKSGGPLTIAVVSASGATVLRRRTDLGISLPPGDYRIVTSSDFEVSEAFLLTADVTP